MRRFPILLPALILLLAALTVSLAVMHIDREPTDAAGAGNIQALWPWWLASGFLWAGLTLLWWKLHHQRGAAAWSARDVIWIVAVATAARIAVVVVHEPALSDDIYRYTFDGRNFAHGMNPYRVRPVERLESDSARWPGEQANARLMNHPQLHTIYLPMSQYVFGGAALLIGEAWSDPSSAARVLRVVFITIDMVLIALVLVALRHAGRSPWWAALYAWHPLVITEVAGSGHQDVIGIALMVAALLTASCGVAGARSWRWAIPLGLAAAVKPVAIVAGLFLTRGRTRRQALSAGALAALVCVGVAAPLLATPGGEPMRNLRETATTFTATWAHFGSVYQPTVELLDIVDPIDDPQVQWRQKKRHETLARLVCAGGVLAVIVVTWLRRVEPWRATRIALLAMVLLSPTAHPWYLLWALALMPGSPSIAVWVLSLTLPWGYAVLGDTMHWRTPGWVYVAAYVPVYVAVLLELAVGAVSWRRSS